MGDLEPSMSLMQLSATPGVEDQAYNNLTHIA